MQSIILATSQPLRDGGFPAAVPFNDGDTLESLLETVLKEGDSVALIQVQHTRVLAMQLEHM